jgi:hypothetical protein
MRWGMLLSVLGCSLAFAEPESETPGLAVFDLKGIDAMPTDLSVALNAVVKGLRELEVFQVLSSEDVRQLLSIERQKQLLGIERDSAALLSMQALGVKHFVVGSVTRTSAGLSAELRLLDSKDNKVASQKTVPIQPSLDKLASILVGVSQELVGAILVNEVGKLLVNTREAGAEIIIDEMSRGSTPLAAPLPLSRGRHRLAVKKDGFETRLSTVVVRKGQLTVEDVTLVPSADYVSAYKQRNGRLRRVGYAGIAVAVAGIAAALTLDRVFAENLFQQEFRPRQEVLEAVGAGRAVDGTAFTSEIGRKCFSNQEECRVQAQKVSQQISVLQAASWVSVGVAVLGAVGAAYCFISGEDPNRYAQLVAAVTPSGGSIGLVGRW